MKAAVAALPTLATCAQPCNDAVCAVCLESYMPGAVLKRLPCEHTFHKECVDAWLLGKVREFAEIDPPGVRSLAEIFAEVTSAPRPYSPPTKKRTTT